MQVRLDSEFGPDSLLGNGSTGLVLIDDEGAVSLFNRQAARLLGMAPDRAIGSSLVTMVADDQIEAWLGQTTVSVKRLSVHIDGRPVDLGIATSEIQDPKYRVVTVRDGSKRRALEAKALAYERGLGGAQIDWNARLKASSLLELLRDFAEEPTSLAALWDMARRTGAILFPLGGAVCTHGSGQFRVQSSWGAMTNVTAFPDAGCLASPNAPSTTCQHFSVGIQGVCIYMDIGRVLLARAPGSTPDEETEALFAETIDFALSNSTLSVVPGV